MYIPCFDHCYVKYGKQYDPEICDTTCDYAMKCLENKKKDEIIEYLLIMLEMEHFGMYSKAVQSIKDNFGIEL